MHQPLERRAGPEPLASDPVDVGEVERLVLGQQVAVPVGVAGTDQGVAVGGELGVGVGGGAGVVGPVVDAGDAGRQALDQAEGDAGVEVVRLVGGRGGPFGREVLEALGHVVAAQGAPHVEVAVDQAGHYDHAGGVDDLRPGGGQPGADGEDAAAVHLHVGPGQGAQLGVHRDDGAAADQVVAAAGAGLVGHRAPFSSPTSSRRIGGASRGGGGGAGPAD